MIDLYIVVVSGLFGDRNVALPELHLFSAKRGSQDVKKRTGENTTQTLKFLKFLKMKMHLPVFLRAR